MSIEANQAIARVLKEFLSTIIRAIYRQDLNEVKIIRIVAYNSIVTKVNNILTPSFIRKHWKKKKKFPRKEPLRKKTVILRKSEISVCSFYHRFSLVRLHHPSHNPS